MRVQWMQLVGFRSFVDTGALPLQQVNVVVGRNNSGKSSLLRGLMHLQEGLEHWTSDPRARSTETKARIALENVSGDWSWLKTCAGSSAVVTATMSSPDRESGTYNFHVESPHFGVIQGADRIPAREPWHFIVPYLSRRKTAVYSEETSAVRARSVDSDIRYLAAKLARLGNPSHPAHERYSSACRAILGFVVTAIPSQSGQRPGVYLADDEIIWIDHMGEGVPNIVHMLVNLSIAKGKLFLLEEPENDLHPSALKLLLDLVVESSRDNQFVISTHSNIVVRHLCAAPDSQLLRVFGQAHGDIPESKVEIVDNTPEARISVLEELGYSFADFDLWEGWLILEEASAERIIRDYLIPWFAPGLKRIRTVSGNGVDRVEAFYAEVHRLVLFTHLMPIYSGRVWVRVDGDSRGKEVIGRLKKTYSDFSERRFAHFSQCDFEQYYPIDFQREVASALNIGDRRERRQAKRELLDRVLRWLDGHESEARIALAQSASEVIDHLQGMERDLAAQIHSVPRS